MEATIGSWQISVQRIWPTGDQLAEIYDAAAPWWHRRMERFGHIRAYGRLIQELRTDRVLGHLTDGSPVLDCGIGTGAFSVALADSLGMTPRVSGVDLAPEMVQRASQRLERRGIKGVVRPADMRLLPFADETFDLVMAAHVLEHLPNPIVGIEDMVRTLRPGAPLLLSVTRSGLPGMLLQLRWRNGSFRPQTVVEMMTEAGLMDCRVYRYPPSLSRWTSVACVGTKPYAKSPEFFQG